MKDSSLLPSLAWLLHQEKSGMRLGLQRIEALLERLDHPEYHYPILHVAGTNGKGSVTAITASLLQAAGYRVGSYTSPHLIELRERIAINGQPIEPSLLEAKIEELRIMLSLPVLKTSQKPSQQALVSPSQTDLTPTDLTPSFFELLTAIALSIFAEQACDIVVLETGLGGRLDATNATPKVAAAITSISLDHQEELGPTLSDIAREKAGIFRPNIPAVSLPQHPEVVQTLQEEAAKKGTPLTFIETPLSSSFSLSLQGEHQRWNAALAVELLALLHQERPDFPSFSEQTMQEGLARVNWPGRFQQLTLPASAPKNGDQPEKPETSKTLTSSLPLILDGAHNPAAIETLITTWKATFGEQKALLLFGALADKKADLMLQQLLPIAEAIYLIPPASERALSLSKLELLKEKLEKLQEACSEIQTFSSLSKIWHQLPQIATQKKLPILVTGSLYLVGEALKCYKN